MHLGRFDLLHSSGCAFDRMHLVVGRGPGAAGALYSY
jgi:hypothetical protein